jgi:hypothetical protein
MIQMQVERLDEDDRVEFEERAAILEYDGGHTRPEAEQLAWSELSLVFSRRHQAKRR